MLDGDPGMCYYSYVIMNKYRGFVTCEPKHPMIL